MMKIVEELKNSKKIIILSHHNADVDSICPSLVLRNALNKMGKTVDVGTAESTSKSVKNFVDNVLINPDTSSYDSIVTVDCASPEQLEPINLDGNLLVIDHHEIGKLSEISKASYIDPKAQTCTELVIDVLDELKYEITEEDASLLIAGIVGDTNHMRLASPKLFRKVADLLEKSDKEYSEILQLMYTETSISEKIALLKSVRRLSTYQIDDLIVTFTTAGSFEAPIARQLLRMGADIAIVATPRKNNLRISSRMKWNLREKINLAEDVFKPLSDLIGGSAGGHDAAASANGTNSDKIGEIFDEMLKRIENKLGKSKQLV